MRNLHAITLAAATILLPLISASPAAAVDAKAVYDAKCARCHGPDGSGDTKPGKKLNVRDLRKAEAQKLTDAEMNDVITNGKEKMPEFKTKLTKEEISALVKFVRTLKTN